MAKKTRGIAKKVANKLRQPPKQTKPSFAELKQSVEKALKGTGVEAGLNQFGEMIFKGGGVKQKEGEEESGDKMVGKARERGRKEAEKTGLSFEQVQKKMRDPLSTGIPTLDRLAFEKKLAEKPRPEIDRIKTGIPGLDELITGGIPRDSTVLITGSPGAGKTIFAMQFLVNGATLFNEPGLYVSFEEDPDSLREGAQLFGWNLEGLDRKAKVKIIFVDAYEIKSFSSALSGQIYNTIRDTKARRIVFDSITYLGVTQENQYKLRKQIAELGKRLKKMGITTLFISEAPEGPADARYFHMDEFAADGVIRLYNLLIKGTRQRAIEVMKLRKTNHDKFLHPFSITDNGIVVYPKEQVFTE